MGLTLVQKKFKRRFISTFEPLKEYSPLGLNLYLLSSQLYLFLDVMSGCLFPSDIHYTFSNFCTVGMYLCFATDFFFLSLRSEDTTILFYLLWLCCRSICFHALTVFFTCCALSSFFILYSNCRETESATF